MTPHNSDPLGSRRSENNSDPGVINIGGFKSLVIPIFTHPGWIKELKEKLEPAEEGLYKLKKEFRLKNSVFIPTQAVRFILTAEISTIYKKDGQTRKVHSLVFAPDFETVKKMYLILFKFASPIVAFMSNFHLL